MGRCYRASFDQILDTVGSGENCPGDIMAAVPVRQAAQDHRQAEAPQFRLALLKKTLDFGERSARNFKSSVAKLGRVGACEWPSRRHGRLGGEGGAETLQTGRAMGSTGTNWRRIVVKLSGEALMGGASHGLDSATLEAISADLVATAQLGVEVAVVVGGGNFFRGIAGAEKGIERARADSIGMLATVMNALALEFAVEKQGHAARALSAVPMPSLCEAYSRQTALHHLGKHRIVILAGGTGNPFFTTDTGAALRAAELSCDVIMKATQVDGVYSADPKRDPHAVRYDRLTHDEAIARNLAVMDTAAFALARENRIPILVFSIKEAGAITAALQGRGRATLVVSEPPLGPA
jgi:uridylate kinase